MTIRSVLLLAALGLFAACAVAAVPPNENCTLPPSLRDEISKAYPHARIVSLADLDEYARKLYRKDFGTRCPGLAKVDFYGDGKPTWALLLVAEEPPKTKPELVVAHQLEIAWDIRSLDKADGAVAVWREKPGKYDDVYTTSLAVRQRCWGESWQTSFAVTWLPVPLGGLPGHSQGGRPRRFD